jgi:hypothetical protein
VRREYARTRARGQGDLQASLAALALLTDDEKNATKHPLDRLAKPVRPPQPLIGAAS